ncbi:hypothetical protein B0H19DRAFT_1081443 [Mycena capillaripes]|nr:hypothetical protein B0H19DRAFT_1081443 [Mycena capillaripes]
MDERERDESDGNRDVAKRTYSKVQSFGISTRGLVSAFLKKFQESFSTPVFGSAVQKSGRGTAVHFAASRRSSIRPVILIQIQQNNDVLVGIITRGDGVRKVASTSMREKKVWKLLRENGRGSEFEWRRDTAACSSPRRVWERRVQYGFIPSPSPRCNHYCLHSLRSGLVNFGPPRQLPRHRRFTAAFTWTRRNRLAPLHKQSENTGSTVGDREGRREE